MDGAIPFTRPSITDAEVEAVAAVLRSGWITAGPRVQEFEDAIAGVTRSAHAVAVSSATSGLFLALKALNIGAGDDVVTVSLTWPSTVNMIELCGARPVFAEIDAETLQIDADRLEEAFTPRTRAVIPVHFGGQPCDLDKIEELCARRGVALIEDAAHAIGTRYRERPVGAGSGTTVFSFHAIKNLTTGEGGMIVTDDGTLASRLRKLRFHGVDTDAWRRHSGSRVSGYDLEEPGWKQNLTDMQAALGLVQLGRLEEIIERRRRLAERYDERLSADAAVTATARVSYPHRHAWHLYTVLVDTTRTSRGRDAIREALQERGIGTGLHFRAVHELSYYAKRYPEWSDGRLAKTHDVAGRIFSLPLFPDMTLHDVDRVVAALEDIA